MKNEGKPKPIVRSIDAIGLIVGIVVGAGIYGFPSTVASGAGSLGAVYLIWAAGGFIALVGALVYAELATMYPNTGGDYYFLRRAFGPRLSFLFGWARMTVIQTGSIATVSFIFGDYMSRILALGPFSSAIYAALIVAILTGLNIMGVRQGTRTQNVLTSLEVLGLLLVVIAGLTAGSAVSSNPAANTPLNETSSFGFMILFVTFTFGGWNEAAYVSGELRDVRRNMARVLVFSVLLVTCLYLLVNWAYLHGLGLTATAKSQQVAADLMQRAFGENGARVISLLVAIAALTTANATIFTGGRSSYALGRDVREFGFLGHWSASRGTPVNGLLIQGALSLALIVLGAVTPAGQGLRTVVDFTQPVFWFFFLLTGIAFFVLRSKDANVDRPFRVPFYPVPPLLFCMMCAYLLYSSLAFTGVGALVGVAVLAVGALLLLFVHPTMSDTKQ